MSDCEWRLSGVWRVIYSQYVACPRRTERRRSLQRLRSVNCNKLDVSLAYSQDES